MKRLFLRNALLAYICSITAFKPLLQRSSYRSDQVKDIEWLLMILVPSVYADHDSFYQAVKKFVITRLRRLTTGSVRYVPPRRIPSERIILFSTGET